MSARPHAFQSLNLLCNISPLQDMHSLYAHVWLNKPKIIKKIPVDSRRILRSYRKCKEQNKNPQKCYYKKGEKN